MVMGIRDKVAILGMGCSRFGERWESGAEQLMLEAFLEALADAGIEKKEIQAAWMGLCMETQSIGISAIPMAKALRLPRIPVSRVENQCTTGAEAFRGACYAVASGACEIALALGVEKLKDTGYGGLPSGGSDFGSLSWQLMPAITGPGAFAQLASGYSAKHGIDMPTLKKAMAHISVKSHDNGFTNPKAHLHRKITEQDVLAAPTVAYPLGLYDCCGVSDGAACAIVTTPQIARALGKKDLVSVKATQLAVSNGHELGYNEYEVDHIVSTSACSARAYAEAGIRNPREDISMIEVHDCFSITELVTMEDLRLSESGGAVKDILDGFYDKDGKIPCQIDGGLKCFGHPIGASGLRMIYEMYLQLQGRAGDRQLPNPRYGLTHNVGGPPFECVCSITIVGRYGD